jgi:hypothetical protein
MGGVFYESEFVFSAKSEKLHVNHAAVKVNWQYRFVFSVIAGSTDSASSRPLLGETSTKTGVALA